MLTRTHAADLSAIAAFIYREARLLDERQFEAWADLFAEDGLYWAPLRRGQTDHVNEMSIFHDDPDMLRARILRLRHPDAHADIPPPSTVHSLTNLELIGCEGDLIEVAGVLLMTEWREQRQTQYAATVRWRLRPTADGDYAIVLKRVELVDCEGFHQYLTVPF